MLYEEVHAETRKRRVSLTPRFRVSGCAADNLGPAFLRRVKASFGEEIEVCHSADEIQSMRREVTASFAMLPVSVLITARVAPIIKIDRTDI